MGVICLDLEIGRDPLCSQSLDGRPNNKYRTCRKIIGTASTAVDYVIGMKSWSAIYLSLEQTPLRGSLPGWDPGDEGGVPRCTRLGRMNVF
jgi:hypothetical protein